VHSTYLQHLLKTYTYTPDELHVLTKTGIKDTATLIPTAITQKAKLQKDFYYYTHITPRITAQPEIIVTKRTELPYTLPDNLIARSIATLRHLKKEELANISKKTEVDIEKTVLQLLDVEKPKTEKELKKLIQDALNELVEAEAKQYGVL
jgi:Spy/CpxP family protein refolding chaperone